MTTNESQISTPTEALAQALEWIGEPGKRRAPSPTEIIDYLAALGYEIRRIEINLPASWVEKGERVECPVGCPSVLPEKWRWRSHILSNRHKNRVRIAQAAEAADREAAERAAGVSAPAVQQAKTLSAAADLDVEALARAHALREAFRQLKQGENVGYDLPRYLAALGYEVRPIEQAAEAADREAAGEPLIGHSPAQSADISAAVAPLDCRACRHVVHPDAECGIPTLTHEGTMPCDCDPCTDWCIEQAAEAASGDAARKPSPSAAADSLEWRTNLSPAEFTQALADAAALDVEALAAALQSHKSLNHGPLSCGLSCVEPVAAAYAAARTTK